MDTLTFIKLSALLVEASALAVVAVYIMSRFPFRHQAVQPMGGTNYYKVYNIKRGDVVKTAMALSRKGYTNILTHEESNGSFSIMGERAWRSSSNGYTV